MPHQSSKNPKDALSPKALVTFVPMPAVDAESGAITQPETREFSAIRNGYTSFKEGDVIFAKITPCMENGKAAIARQLENSLGFGSTEFHVLRPTGAILPEFVYQFVRQEAFRKAAEAEMTGSVEQKRVPADFMKAGGSEPNDADLDRAVPRHKSGVLHHRRDALALQIELSVRVVDGAIDAA